MSSPYANLTRPELETLVDELRAIIMQQNLRIAELERKLAALSKNSSNASKPPSSDIVKPPRKPRDANTPQSPRKAGAQPGHPMHQRPDFEADQIQATEVYTFNQCPVCGGEVTATTNDPKVLQKVQLTEQVPWAVIQHEAHACHCARCNLVHYAPMPAEVVRGGMLCPKFLALIAYLKGVMHACFSTIRKYFRDVLKLPISRGRLAKAVQQVSESLEQTHDALGQLLPAQGSLRIDETGHKNNDTQQRYWTWCFRADDFTWFHIDPTRSSQVLRDVLGESFEGVLSCDYFSAYRKYLGDTQIGATESDQNPHISEPRMEMRMLLHAH